MSFSVSRIPPVQISKTFLCVSGQMENRLQHGLYYPAFPTTLTHLINAPVNSRSVLCNACPHPHGYWSSQHPAIHSRRLFHTIHNGGFSSG